MSIETLHGPSPVTEIVVKSESPEQIVPSSKKVSTTSGARSTVAGVLSILTHSLPSSIISVISNVVSSVIPPGMPKNE